MALSAGTRLGPYEVIAPLGAGGMGEVYRALDHRLGREVAIKTLPEALAHDPERRPRFEREARALAALAHPAIATLHEIGEADGRPFLVMELVEGQTLAERMAAGPLPLPAALALGAQLAEGLAVAHARGIVHRDLKPANLALTRDGRLKILDFGLAKTGAGPASGGDPARSPAAVPGLTSSGMLLGTAGFMSPEQVRGEPVDARADAWAFGCILFELVTGFRAFSGSSPWEVLAAVMSDAPAWSRLPPQLPPAVESVLRRCLEKDPGRRLADLGEARLALGGPSSGSAVTWVSAARPRHFAPRVSRRAAAAAVIAVVALAAGAGGVAWWRHRETPASLLPSLAILPFRELGAGGGDEQWLGEGLAAAVSAQLADVDGVRVFPAWSTLEAVEKGADPMRVAKLLGADLVLSGTVQSAGREVRVTFALLEAPGGSQRAGGTVTAAAGSLFAAQDELAGEVLSALDLAEPRLRDNGGLPQPGQQDRYLEALGLLQRADDKAAGEKAVAILEQLAREAPSSPLVYSALGRAFLDRFTMTDDASWATLAASYCERARQIAPHRPEVELTLAQLATLTGKPQRALTLLRHVLALQPANSDALRALGSAFEAAGDAPAAEEAYRRVVAVEPRFWRGYSKLGGFYFRHGRFGEAAAMFRRVTELNPDSALGFTNLGGALLAAGDLEGSLAACRRSVAIERTPGGLSNMGTLLYSLGRFDEAVGAFQEATALAPDSFALELNLADAYRWSSGLRGRAPATYQRAITLAREQLAVNPEDRAVRTRLAVVLARVGDQEGATRELERARIPDDDPEAWANAAMVALIGGRRDDAVVLLRKAVVAGYDPDWVGRDPDLASLGVQAADLRATTKGGQG